MLLAWNRWLSRATSIIADSAPALDAMNVFPISDSDTGTNLRLTLEGIERSVPDLSETSLDAMVQAAILSAHGNSGAIVAEMFASVCRALEFDISQGLNGGAGRLIANLLRTVAVAANRAVARPVAGTILTVADSAADAAEVCAQESPRGPLQVALAAQQAAREALARTPQQLDVLARAGVVDAGGQAFVLLLDVLVEVLGGPPAEPLGLPAVEPTTPGPMPDAPREYEVMYTLEEVDEAALAALREELSVVGHSVVVVGDRALAQVHVHLADAGAAVEAGLGHGRPRRIRITVLDAAETAAARRVLSLVDGPGIAELVGASGAIAVEAPAGTGWAQSAALAGELAAELGDLRGDAIVLTNGLLDPEEVRRLVAMHAVGRTVEVIASAGQVGGLAAVAVHEPTSDFATAVEALRRAADLREGAVRRDGYGFTAHADGRSLGSAPSLRRAALVLLDALARDGAELVSVVLGAVAYPELAEELTTLINQRYPDAEVEVVQGGQSDDVVLIGVE